MTDQLENTTLNGLPENQNVGDLGVQTKQSSIQEDLARYTQEDLNRMAVKGKERGYEKGFRDAQQANEGNTSYAQGNGVAYQQPKTQPSAAISEDVIARAVDERFARLREEEQHLQTQMQEEQKQARLRQEAEIYSNKIESAISANPEYSIINENIDGNKCGHLAMMTRNFENGPDILLHLAKNTGLLAELNNSLSVSPEHVVESRIKALSDTLIRERQLKASKQDSPYGEQNKVTNQYQPSMEGYNSENGGRESVSDMRKRSEFRR